MSDDRIKPDELVANPASDYNHLLLVLAAHPAPQPFVTFYEQFVSLLTTKFESLGLLKHVYIYTPQQLHITVATLHPSKLPSNDLSACASVWASALSNSFHQCGGERKYTNTVDGVRENFRNCGEPEAKYPCLQLRDATMDNSVGVLLWDDPSTAFSDWRDCICDASRRPDVIRMVAEAGSDATTIRLPNIVHSTVLRWRSTPEMSAHELKKLFVNTFHEVLRLQSDHVTIYVDNLRIIEEEARCMEQSTTHHVFPL